MSTNTLQFDTQHEDMIHDAQLDYYGKRLATCSSDGSIRIFEVSNQQQKFVEALKSHTGPVWQVSWAHPKFGSVLASCSYDGTVLIWKETGSGFAVIHKHDKHQASVNAIAWASHELGPVLLCGSSDGKISLVSFTETGTWEVQMIRSAHATGVNAVSWAPVIAANEPTNLKLFATGGCDNNVKIWAYSDETKTHDVVQTLSGHSDWVRDVAFAPNSGLPRTYLASCSQDKNVYIWTRDAQSESLDWKQQALEPFPDVVWRVSWSLSGNVLAVSCGDNRVTLWKENVKGEWECISEANESSQTA
ncbi:GTPase-activating protein S13 [Coemansia sp. RSA 520]|nr:GTPase-activating protein S13 [Coemansia sp. RSA 520]KAJ2434758.1 GTPase-activating protein S13 [Coemansia sp. RSA 2440]